MNPCTGWLRGLSQLERITAKGNKSEQPAVGAFTTESRTRWAQIRETLMAVRRRACRGVADRSVRAMGLPVLHVGLPLGRAGCARLL